MHGKTISGKTAHYATLDGMRGVAAIAVVLLHAGKMVGPHMESTSAILAVDFFFCLSGFVICHAYEQQISAGMPLKTFVSTRLIRLGPLFVLGQLLGFAIFGLMAISGHTITSAGVEALRDIVNIVGLPSLPRSPEQLLYPLNIPAWSLFFELAINIAFVGYLRSGLRSHGKVLLALFATAIIFCFLMANDVSGADTWGTFHIALARVCWSFSAGVALYRIKDFSWVERVRFPAPALYVILAVLLVVEIPSGIHVYYDLALILVVLPLLVLAGSSGSRSGRINRVEKALGGISYPVYITHYPLHLLYAGLIARLFHRPAESLAPLAGLAFIPVAFGCALLFSRFVDVPVRHALGQRFGRRQSQP